MKRKRRPGAADKYTAARRRHMKWLTAVICMAVLVAFGTVYGLMMPATAMEGETYCGMTEHTHSASCYSSELTCGLAQDGTHVHDSSCYTEVLTCQIPEHTHSESCYVNPNETQPQSGTQTGDTTVSAGTQNGSTTTSSGTQDTASPSGTAAGDNGVISGNGEAGNGSGTGDVTGTGNNGVSGDTGNAGDANSTDVTGNGEDIDETGESETTVDTEETQPESMEAEPVEAAALPSGAQIPEGYTQQYTVRDEVNGFAVTVYAPEGVVPEGAVLTAQMLNVGDAAYTAAEQELDAEVKAALAEDGVSALSADEAAAAGTDTSEAAEPDYGFAALDIHFEDANGNEVEPNGNVYVSIDAAGLLPEDADPETVTVQHHAEQANGDVTVETVADAADATDGVVEVVESNANAGTAGDVQAAFTVSGFSTFTIVWKDNYFDSLSIQIIDTEGHPIGGDGEIGDWGDNKINGATSIQDIVEMVDDNDTDNILDGYEFSRAVVSSSANNAVNVGDNNYVERIRYQSYKNNYWGRWQYNTNVTGTNNWNDIGDKTLYLIYENNSTPGGGTGGSGGGTTVKPTPGYAKTATLNNDGTYDLTLSVTGSVGSETNPAMLDVLFIVDRSNSMTNDGSRRLDNAKDAMETLVNSLESNNNIDARYSIVTFSGPRYIGGSHGESDASIHMNWTSVDGNNVNNSIQSITTIGGTNYQAGLDRGNDQLRSVRNGASTVVIFLSDGQPTLSYDYGDGGSALGLNSRGWEATLNEARNMTCTYFYAIDIGAISEDYLNALIDTVNATTKQYLESDDEGSDLSNLFNDIVGSVTSISLSNVSITDTLSENVEAVTDVSGNPSKLVVTVTDANGNNVTGQVSEIQINADGSYATGDNNIYPTFDSATGTVQLHFPTSYTLVDGYTYSVTLQIQPSAQAEIDYAQRETYPDIPDERTGTHATNHENGYFSNEDGKATLTYRVEGEQENTTVQYLKPVVQVQKGYLALTKTLAEGTTVEDGTTFTFIISIPAQYAATYNTVTTGAGLEQSTVGTLTFTTENDAQYATTTVAIAAGQTVIIALPDNIQATIVENEDAYNATWSGATAAEDGSVSVTVKKTQRVELTCANEDAVTYENVIIHKTDNDNKPLADAEFRLYYTEDGINYYYTESIVEDTVIVTWNQLSEDEGSPQPTTLTSDGNGDLIFHDLDISKTYYLVETKAPDGYQQLSSPITISWNESGILTAYYDTTALTNIDQDTNTITVTNSTGAILPETGGVGTTYMTIGGLLLIAAAVGGGYGLKRRQRRGRI